jgi:hypothetical protein
MRGECSMNGGEQEHVLSVGRKALGKVVVLGRRRQR